MLPWIAALAFGAALARPAVPDQPPAPPAAQPPAPPAEAAPATPAAPSPHIQFDAVDLNLGEVIRGQDAVATFTYRNTGPVPLHILSAKPG